MPPASSSLSLCVCVRHVFNPLWLFFQIVVSHVGHSNTVSVLWLSWPCVIIMCCSCFDVSSGEERWSEVVKVIEEGGDELLIYMYKY